MVQPLAVIGMACRFPGGINRVSAFWDLLKSGREAVGNLPRDRWDVEGWHYNDTSRPGKSYAAQGGFLTGIDLFDAEFFGISPREASRMDPQQRLLLEMTWEALEDAGAVPSALAGSETAVVFGISSVDYLNVQLMVPESVDAYTNPGCSPCIGANRVSYFFDFRGPSFIIDTACSSSLTAINLACEAIWNGRAPLAIAGGVSALLAPFPWVGFSKAQMLSHSGRCRVFDAEADGYVRSEGGGVLVIKPLDRAQADGDPIRATILACGLNSDGRTRGMFYPSARAHEALLRDVYGRAGIDPARVAYVEAHGTGTTAGDPVECEALGAALGQRRERPLYIGSVKTNLGHLEAAAGIAGAMKVILSLQHRELPPNLHFRTPNPRIPFAEMNLAVTAGAVPLADCPEPLVMGVNSFGYGGANAHVVFEEYREPARTAACAAVTEVLPLFLSARTPEALSAATANYARFLAEPGAPPVYDVCHTAALHREHHAHRLAVFGASREEFVNRLTAFSEAISGRALAGAERPVYVFSGNGSQWPGMGRELIRESRVFREAVERLDGDFAPLAGWSVAKALLDPAIARRLNRTEVAQPLLFAVQVGTVELLKSCGLEPHAVVGHSVGEVAAAWAAGIYSMGEAAKVIYARSQAQACAAGRGKMAACGLSEGRAVALLAAYGGALEVASVNSPSSVTLSGDAGALEDLRTRLEPQGVFFKLLDLDYPFHSRLIEDVRGPLLRSLDGLRPAKSRIPFVSSTTGGALDGEEMNAEYWWRNVRRPVLFANTLEHLIRRGQSLFVEAGPHPVLCGYIRQCLEAAGVEGRAIPTLCREQPEVEQVRSAVSLCYVSGAALDMRAIFPAPARPVSLPAYPWQKERHWNGEAIGHPSFPRSERQHPLLGYRSASADFTWENEIDLARLPYLRDHKVLGATVFPAAGLLEMALKAAQPFRGDTAAAVEDFALRSALPLQESRSVRVRLSIRAEDGTFRIETRAEDANAWTLLATGRLAAPARGSRPAAAQPEDLASPTTAAWLYEDFASRGLQFGPAFSLLEEIRTGPGAAIGRLSPGAMTAEAGYCFHPAVLDACFQIVGAIDSGGFEPGVLYLPAGIRRVRMYAEGGGAVFSQARTARQTGRSIVADVRILDAGGGVVADLEGFRLQRVETAMTRSTSLPLLEVRAVLKPGRMDRTAAPAELIEPASFARALDVAVAHRAASPLSPVRAWADEVCGLFAREALEALGAGDGAFDVASLAERGGLALERIPLLGRLVEYAHEDGFARPQGERWVLTEKLPAQSAAEVWHRGAADFPAHLAETQLLGCRGASLLSILHGESAPPCEPAVEHLNDQAPAALRMSTTLRALTEELVRHWPGDRILRVLEVCGDSGPVAQHVLPLLPAECSEYCLACGDQTALDRYASRFADWPFLRSVLLDSSFDARDFDVVLASAEVLGRARELTRPGGLFVLIERPPQRFVELTFGLSSSNARFHDREEWMRQLCENGFEHVSAAGEPPSGVAESDVILAWNPLAETPEPAGAVGARTWLVLRDARDDGGLLERLMAGLAGTGHRVIQVMPGVAYKRPGPDLVLVPRNDPDAFRRMFQDLASEGIRCDELVHGWGLTRQMPETNPALAELIEDRCLTALSLVQGLIAAELPALPRLWLLTSGAIPVSETCANVSPAQAPLWGLGRVLANENPRFVSKLVDLHWENNAQAIIDRLMREFGETDAEDEVLLTEQARYVHRVRRGTLGESGLTLRRPEREAGFHIALDRPGSLDHLFVEERERCAPATGQVEIRVRAAGLNFRDVMLSLGLLPDEAIEGGFAGPSLGMECAGEVVRVGKDVSGLRPGDAVVAFAPDCFSKYVVADASHVLPKPDDASYEAAATMLTASATAIYALEHLGRVQPGERLLIHGAAGGVGLAAIQYAAHAGLEVFATAGTAEKRDYLSLLGVRHVFSSRTADFAGQILEATGGEGVDVVLNSLAGDAVASSFSVLRPFGRFLELGKRDFAERNRMAMAPFRNNLSYFGIDLDQVLAARPGLRDAILSRVMELAHQGVLRPLPYRVFPVSRVGEAFRHMQRSRHIGKIVVSFDDDGVRVRPRETPGAPLRQDGTYLVTGGVSGLGLETARWMSRNGARHLVLASRSGPASAEASEAVAELRASGVEVLVGRADVADEEALGRLLTEAAKRMPPLQGVVHAAMVLDDALIPSLTAERFWRAARCKILGAWNLHRLTLDAPLDFFVLYSSAASLLGNPGQANYAAGNLFLEALARHRRGLGRCATSIAWGAISDVGYLARNPGVRDKVESRYGVRPTSSWQAILYLERLLKRDRPCWGAADVNWAALESMGPSHVRSAKFASLIQGGTATAALEDVLSSLSSLPLEKKREVVTGILAVELARVLRGAAARVDVNRPLVDLGMDSLMAVELLTAVETRFHVQITPMEIVGGVTLAQIASRIAEAPPGAQEAGS